MRSKITSGVAWYKDFVGQTFTTKETGNHMTVNTENDKDLLLSLGVKVEATALRIRKEDCSTFDAYGYKVEPCKYCKKLSRKELCTECGDAAKSVRYLLSFPNGKNIIERLTNDTADSKDSTGDKSTK